MLRSIHSVCGSCSGPNVSWVSVVSATDRVRLEAFELLVAEDDWLTERHVVLPKREAFPGLGHQDAPQVGMAIELDAKEIPGFALVPVCRRPDRRQAGHMRIRHARRALDPDPRAIGEGPNLPDDGEAWVSSRPIDRGVVEEVIKAFLIL